MKFNRLTIIKEDGVIWKDQRKAFLCKCDCGTYIKTVLKNLRNGNTKSCGCLNKELTIKRNYKHGHSTRKNTSKEYMVYRAMVARCVNPKNKAYKYYGGRGIKVGKEFLGEKGFSNYLQELGPKPNKKNRWTVGRINNNVGYRAGNVRWENYKQQANNTSKTIKVTYMGKTQTLSAWADQLGITWTALYTRYIRGWGKSEMLSGYKRKLANLEAKQGEWACLECDRGRRELSSYCQSCWDSKMMN